LASLLMAVCRGVGTLPATDSPARWRWRQLIPTCDLERRLRSAFTSSIRASASARRSRSRLP